MTMIARAAAACIALSALGFSAAAAAEVRAIFATAEWCGPCHVLEPKLLEAIDETGGGVEIVYLDFTDLSDENLQAQFDRADPLTEDDFRDGASLKIGFAYLLADDNFAGEITADMSTDDIVEVIEQALGR